MKNRKSKVRARLLDETGREVPKSEYDLDLGEEDFTFTLRRPGPDRSGRFRVVLENDAGEGGADVEASFIGESGNCTFC